MSESESRSPESDGFISLPNSSPLSFEGFEAELVSGLSRPSDPFYRLVDITGEEMNRDPTFTMYGISYTIEHDGIAQTILTILNELFELNVKTRKNTNDFKLIEVSNLKKRRNMIYTCLVHHRDFEKLCSKHGWDGSSLVKQIPILEDMLNVITLVDSKHQQIERQAALDAQSSHQSRVEAEKSKAGVLQRTPPAAKYSDVVVQGAHASSGSVRGTVDADETIPAHDVETEDEEWEEPPPPSQNEASNDPELIQLKDQIKLLLANQAILTRELEDIRRRGTNNPQSGSRRQSVGAQYQAPQYIKKPPRMNVNPFKGDKTDFLRFETTFKERYEGTGVSNIHLAISLGELLEGDAKARFGHMCIAPTENTYTTLWENMEKVYGNRREYGVLKLSNFNNLPHIHSFNPTTISTLMTTLNEHWEMIKKTMGDEYYDPDHYIFYSFLQKLPIEEVAKFKTHYLGMGKLPNFPNFKQWLEIQWEIYKSAKDQGKLDRALVMWQTGQLDQKAAQAVYMSLTDKGQPRHKANMSGCTTSDIRIDAEGNAVVLYTAPEGEHHLIMRNGVLEAVDSYEFKTPMPEYKSRELTHQQPGLVMKNDKITFGMNGSNGNGNKKPGPKLSQSKDLPPCSQCNVKGHAIWTCKDFITLDVPKRYDVVKEKRLCLRCLRTGHIARDCRVRFRCDINNCGRQHHRLLHSDAPLTSSLSQYYAQGVMEDAPWWPEDQSVGSYFSGSQQN